MANIPWLPPLNNPHFPSRTTVKIHQHHPFPEEQPHPHPVLSFFAFAEYESDSRDPRSRQPNFHGLNYLRVFDEQPGTFETDYASCTNFNTYSAVMASLPCINSEQNRINFSHRHLDEAEASSPELIPSGQDEIFRKIHMFLCEALERTGHVENTQFVLEMRMEIVVPDDMLQSWHSWYDAKAATDPYFDDYYWLATNRPRTEEELLEEDVSRPRRSIGSLNRFQVVVDGASAESCSICLEDFFAGRKVIKLPCGHLFDEGCIKTWLQENYVCPICRSNVDSPI